MTKKQRQSRAAVMEILRVTRITQKQFAEDIGEDARVVRQWTMGAKPRLVPPEYRERIAAFYGAVWNDKGNVYQAGSGEPRRFTRKSFEGRRTLLVFMHRNRCGFPRMRRTNGKPWTKPNGEPYHKNGIEDFLFSRSLDVLCRTLRAAEGRGGGNNSRRLFAVIASFLRWSQGIIEDFKLADSKEIQDVHRVLKRSGIIERTNQRKYIPMMKSVTTEISLPPNIAASFIIEKGSPRHNAHIEYLKAAAKKGDKDAIANLKQYGIEVETTAEKLRR
jgi:hypothetical protein